MGLFKKKEKKDQIKEIPSLPELPSLPDFPRLEDEETSELKTSIHQLPSFPSNSFGKKFSQISIKDAVTGKKEGVDGPEVDEFDMIKEDMRMIQGPLKRSVTEEIPFEEMEEEELIGNMNASGGTRAIRRNVEPVFIRIDKFEEGLHIFKETKKKISNIEKILEETKRLKEKEEKELQDWENELRIIKNQIEKIDQDIFSKIQK